MVVTRQASRVGLLLDMGASDVLVWPRDCAVLRAKMRRAWLAATVAAERDLLKQLFEGVPALREPPSGPPAARGDIARASAVATAIGREAAEREGANASLLRQIVDAFPGPVIVKEASGRFVFVNEATARLYGRTAEELVGLDIDASRLLPEHIAAAKSADANVLAGGPPSVQKGEWKGADGAIHCFLARRARLDPVDDRGPRLLMVATDVTDLLAAQDAAEQARKRAVDASEAKSQFLAKMSHEIRTPLNGVLGMLSLAAETELTAEQRDFIEAAQSSGESLLGIISDILDLSKIESGRLTLEQVPVHVFGLLDEALRPLSSRARQKGLTFDLSVEPDVPRAILSDPVRLRQIVVNLVGNAVKFTAAGSVRVTVRLDPADAHKIRVRVADTGIGIPPEKQTLIFEAFAQADDSTTRTFGGTGLGLSICKELVALFGGALEVESQAGRGSAFEFALPFVSAAPQAADETAASEPHIALATTPIRVLLAEDNPVNQTIATKLLTKLGCSVTSVADGAAAVEKVLSERFDLVLMDVQMPILDGLEATRQIRAREATKGGERVHVVALTANAMEGDSQACKAAGMDGYLSKPIERVKLRSVLESAAERCRTAQRAASEGRIRIASTEPGPLDLAQALERLGRDRALLADVVTSFRSTFAQMMQALHERVNAGDVGAAAWHSQNMKIALLAIGAMRASDLASALEAAARAGDLSRAPDLLSRVDAELARIDAALELEFPPERSSPGLPQD